MTDKKVATKSSKVETHARRKLSAKASAENGTRSVAASNSSRNGSSSLSANELTLRAWKKVYANRKRFGKFD